MMRLCNLLRPKNVTNYFKELHFQSDWRSQISKQIYIHSFFQGYLDAESNNLIKSNISEDKIYI